MKATILIMIVIFMSSIFPQVNPNGGFEDSTPGPKVDADIPGWTLGVGGAASADFAIVEDNVYEGSRALSVVLQGVDANAWDVQIVNETFVLQPNTQYTYSIWVMADVEGSIANFTVGNLVYSEFGRMGGVAITTDWQEVTFSFTTPADADTARAPIHLAESANGALVPIGFYFDELSITPTTVSVDSKSNLPDAFSLEQNYPNPFNPSTKIQFNLPQNSNVRILLYDVLGKVVKEVVNGFYNTGTHQALLNASDLTAGIYFYKMEAGNFSSTKKLSLIK